MENLLGTPSTGNLINSEPAIPAGIAAIIDEHDLYPVHEEDSVPVIPRHFWQNNYLAYAVQTYHPKFWVVGDTCLYWQKGVHSPYRAPDVTVISGSPPEDWPNVYLSWLDPPLLFVAEIGSRSTFMEDTGPKAEIYEEKLRVPEYLYTNRKGLDLRLWRMVNEHYQLTPKDAEGKVWSEQLGLGFGYDEKDFLRVYTPQGQALPTYEEAQQSLTETRHALTTAQRQTQLEVEARMEAERRAQLSEQHAQILEEQSQLEALARAEMEKQLAELTAELERLRRQMPQEEP